jgi:hypothetical protein
MPQPRRAVAGRRTYAGLFTRQFTRLTACALLLGLIVACSSTDPRIPTALTLDATSLSFTSVGEQQQLSPTITDEDGKTLSADEASWSSSDPAVATVSQSGLVTAQGSGSAQVTATAGSVSDAAQISVVQIPAQLQKVSGDTQTAPAGSTLAAPLVVKVTDAEGSPIQNMTIVFSVSEGEGSVSTTTAVTGAEGTAATTFTTGTIAGAAQIVSATVEGTSLSASFSAIAASDPTSFNIGIRFLSEATPSQRKAFDDARLRWEAAISQDLEDGQLNAPAGSCGSTSPAVNQIIDDVLILVTLVDIDGAGGVLGGASPCWIRDPGSLTIMGTMQFDSVDLDMLETEGILSNVVLHEMGHVLGIGTLWTAENLLADPSLPPDNGSDPHFTGPQAITAFNDVGGTAYVGAKVPVENTGGPGTADGHWRESVLNNELMTGFIGAGPSPLSVVTLGSLADQGYGVNVNAADPFSLVLALRSPGSTRPLVHLDNDILPVPIRKVNSRGQQTGELRR